MSAADSAAKPGIRQRTLLLVHDTATATPPRGRAGAYHVTRTSIVIGSKHQRPPCRELGAHAEATQRMLLAKPRRVWFDISRDPDLFVALGSLVGLLVLGIFALAGWL